MNRAEREATLRLHGWEPCHRAEDVALSSPGGDYGWGSIREGISLLIYKKSGHPNFNHPHFGDFVYESQYPGVQHKIETCGLNDHEFSRLFNRLYPRFIDHDT